MTGLFRLADRDWHAIAAMAVEILPPFGLVEGVPDGGLPFAGALYLHPSFLGPFEEIDPAAPLLIVEDVLTTGASMERARAGRDAIGVCVFARGPCPPWVRPIFQMNLPGG